MVPPPQKKTSPSVMISEWFLQYNKDKGLAFRYMSLKLRNVGLIVFSRENEIKVKTRFIKKNIEFKMVNLFCLVHWEVAHQKCNLYHYVYCILCRKHLKSTTYWKWSEEKLMVLQIHILVLQIVPNSGFPALWWSVNLSDIGNTKLEANVYCF